MRENKFRGKRIDNGEWVYGYFLKAGNIYYIAVERYNESIVFSQQSCDSTYIFYRIDPNTLGQYTGLNDKNGVEVCEGDVVVLQYVNLLGILENDLDYDTKGYIVIDNGQVTIRRKERNDYPLFHRLQKGQGDYIPNYGNLIVVLDNNIYGEIIGNIHDNKELVEG